MQYEKVVVITIDAKTLLLIAVSIATLITLISAYASPWITQHEKAPSLDIIDFKVKVKTPDGQVFLYDCNVDLINPCTATNFTKYKVIDGAAQKIGMVSEITAPLGSQVNLTIVISAAAGYFAPYGPYVSYYLYPYGYYYPYYTPYAYHYYYFFVQPISFTAIMSLWSNTPAGIAAYTTAFTKSSLAPNSIGNATLSISLSNALPPGSYNMSIFIWDDLLPSGGLRKAIDSGFFTIPLKVEGAG